MSKLADLHERWSREPEYREAYDGLGLEFELSRSLIEARTRAKLTQAELAERMQTTQSVIAPAREWSEPTVDEDVGKDRASDRHEASYQLRPGVTIAAARSSTSTAPPSRGREPARRGRRDRHGGQP